MTSENHMPICVCHSRTYLSQTRSYSNFVQLLRMSRTIARMRHWCHIDTLSWNWDSSRQTSMHSFSLWFLRS
ncbi:hypothetical protein ATCV1_z634R [Acanthocystis turfacea chlorella virus 1]|uniref:Uncharacterized protein z634R n=1 Tax=Chlorovirus heliozoae TaxID=322019 RepID=A7K9P4_9PHYC|nr:hypothetical protein ATCV1_z634R [Acanthocystis turfacea chlorella virus 1]ABT16768.1 hypothetical protein ATCV1_z634R [Acanthocystis turfacea chlorella virus 1]